MRTVLLLCVLAVCATIPAEGQAIRFDSSSTTTSASCVSGRQCPLLVLPGTQVNFCQGTPSTLAACLASPATTYTSASAGVACAPTSQLTPAIGGACLSTADSQGGYGAWLLPGSYGYYLRVPATAGGGTYGPYPVSIHGDSGGYTLDSLYTTLSLACTAAGSGTLAITKVWSATPSQTLPCAVLYLGNGKIQANTSATIAFTGTVVCPSYQQCFDTTTNSGAAVTFTKPPSNLGPVQFGADPTGVADSLAAFNAAYASGNNQYLPLGAYTLSGEFSMTRAGSSFHCEGTKPGAGQTNKDTIIQYTGSSLIRSVFRVTAGGSGDDLVENCYIRGNIHTTYAMFLDAPNGSVFRNIRVDGGLTAALFHSVGVANLIDHVAIQTRAPNTTAVGLLVDGSNTLTVISPNIDGFRVASSGFDGIGIKSINSAAIHVIGGTSEGNYINVQNGSNSSLDLYSMDNEAATLYGLDDSGTTIVMGGLHGGNMHYSATAINSSLRNTNTDQITVDAGAKGIMIEGNTYASTFGTITNNGTCTFLIRNRAANAGTAYTPDLFGCAGLDFGGGVNYIYETAGADNALVGTFTPARADGARIPANYPTIPLKDGMEFNIKLSAHSLQAGANTFDFLDGTGPHAIKKASNPTQNLGTAYGVGASIKLRYDADGGIYVDLRQ